MKPGCVAGARRVLCFVYFFVLCCVLELLCFVRVRVCVLLLTSVRGRVRVRRVYVSWFLFFVCVVCVRVRCGVRTSDRRPEGKSHVRSGCCVASLGNFVDVRKGVCVVYGWELLWTSRREALALLCCFT